MRLRAREIQPKDQLIGEGQALYVRAIEPDVSSPKSKRPLLRIKVRGHDDVLARPDTFFEVERRQPKGTRRNAGGGYFTPEHDGLDSIRELLL
jgi:hypothetical protein